MYYFYSFALLNKRGHYLGFLLLKFLKFSIQKTSGTLCRPHHLHLYIIKIVRIYQSGYKQVNKLIGCYKEHLHKKWVGHESADSA